MKCLAMMMVLLPLVVLAGQVPIDNRFLMDGKRLVRGWTFNSPEAFKPYGDVKEVMLKGSPGIRLVSAGKQTQIYSAVPIPVKAGEKYRVSAKIRGTGSCSLGFFMYGPKWAWRGGSPDRYTPTAGVGGEASEVSAVIVIPNGVINVRPQLCSLPGGSVEFFDLQVEKVGELPADGTERTHN